MEETLKIVWTLLVGVVLGTFFYGGLWFTIKMAMKSTLPALWFLCSFLLRMSIILFGFYYVSPGNWQKLIICVLGFIIARFVVTRYTKMSDLKKEMYHET